MSEHVSREEFSMLRGEVAANAARLDAIDQAGTRGVSALAVQVGEVIKDVAAVQNGLDGFRRDHERLHEREAADRVTSRRWLIATAVALLAAVEGPLLYLIAHIH